MAELSLEQIETMIEDAPAEEQRRFLARLPRLLKLQGYGDGLLKTAESSFDFWNNEDDAIYDKL